VNTFYIDAVRTVQGSSSHDRHISQVRLTNGQVLTRDQVINDISYHRVTFYTYKPGVQGAKVIVHPCPHCRSRSYITTEPDWTPTNNLLHLPAF
jgi:hypothetical protein